MQLHRQTNREKKRKNKHLTSSWACGFRGRVGPAPLQPLQLLLHNHSSSSTTSALTPTVRGLWSSGNGVRGVGLVGGK
jgi:hypothetical protein